MKPFNESLDTESVSDQFRANMIMEESEFNIGFVQSREHQVFLVQQNRGKNFLIVPDPDSMRVIGQSFIELADKWERGELPGMAPPKKDGE